MRAKSLIGTMVLLVLIANISSLSSVAALPNLSYLWLARWTSGSTINVALATPPTGYALVLTASIGGKTITSVTENGATWKKAINLSTQASADSEIWYATNTNTAGTNINVTLSGIPTAGFVAVLQFSGISSELLLDRTGSASGSGSNATTVRSGITSTTSVGNELWIASLSDNNQLGFLFLGTPSNGFTGASFGEGSLAHELAYKIVSATGTASTSDSTFGSAYGLVESWNGCVATFSTPT